DDSTCMSPLGGYLDALSAHNFQPSSATGGDSVFTFLGISAEFYGEQYTDLRVTPQGFALFGGDYTGEYYLPQILPDPSPPNGLLAALWADTEVVRQTGVPSGGGERGITVVTYNGGELLLVEYDNPQVYGNPDQVLGDYQLVMWAEDGPGPDAFIVFGEQGQLPTEYSIGTEHRSGANGTMVTEDLETLWQPNVTICFDYQGAGGDPIVLSYDVTVDNDADLGIHTNQ